MPILNYGEGSRITKHRGNGLVAIETTPVTGIVQARLPVHAVFLVEDHVSSVETWEGDRMPERLWRPGDIAFLPRGSVLESIPKRPYNESVLWIEDDDLIKLTRSYVNSAGDLGRFADATSPETTNIVRTLRNLIVSGESEAWPLLTDSLTVAMVIAVTKQLSTRAAQAIDAERPALSPERMKRVQDFIEANLGNKIRLDDMANAAALSPYHFCRSFKESFGVSPIRYVLDRRVEEAKAMMKTTGKSLTEIALACGFASQSHFTTAFKAVVGMTPRCFRSPKSLFAGISTTYAASVQSFCEFAATCAIAA